MKKQSYILLVLLVLSTTLCSKEEGLIKEKTIVYGKVTDGETGDPVRGVKILVTFRPSGSSYAQSEVVDSTTTDEAGEYEKKFKPEVKFYSKEFRNHWNIWIMHPAYYRIGATYHNAAFSRIIPGTVNEVNFEIYQ